MVKNPLTDEENYFPLQVLFSGYRVENLIKKKFREKIYKFAEDDFEVIASNIEFILRPLDYSEKRDKEYKKLEDVVTEIKDTDDRENEDKEIDIRITLPFTKKITFSHRHDFDYKDMKLLLSCDDEELMRKIIDSHKEVLKNV